MPDDTAQRLAEAARMWRNLRGILRLLGEDDSVDDATYPTWPGQSLPEVAEQTISMR